VLKFVVIGPPGSDFYQQAVPMAAMFGLEVVQMMDVVLANVRERTQHGVEFIRLLDNGTMPSAELMMAMVTDRLARAENGWLLAGFPRTLAQAELLAAAGQEPTEVIELDLEHGAVGRRFDDYLERSRPLANYYRARGTYQTLPGGYTRSV
jgi:adenylate kinase